MTHIHLIGIGGAGMSAIARVLLESGITVSGSDRAPSALADSLAETGARVFTGHAAENVRGADLVVRSSAVRDDNPEVIAARAAGIPVLKRAEFLGQLIGQRFCLAVAGTHGKTTTTAMTALALSELGQQPSFIVGGVVKDLGSNAHAGQGRVFIIEADEYDHMFLGLSPDMIILTAIEHDHPDCFPTPADYDQAFVEFIQRLRPGGKLVACIDDPGVRRVSALLRAGGTQPVTYGLGADALYQARDPRPNPRGGFDFTFNAPGEAPLAVSLQAPGLHNVRNAAGVLAAVHQMALPLAGAAAALGHFSGTGRRFDLLGEAGGVVVINDYAHHPTAIRATLAAARARFDARRIWAVWQPHTYSRTRALLPEFAAAFGDADQVLVTEVYAARETSDGFSAQAVVQAMDHPGAHFVARLDDAARFLLDRLQPGDVLLVLSAGDADQISAAVLAALRERNADHA
jgi:UDP-N-acetylmuramate--alanine ligase